LIELSGWMREAGDRFVSHNPLTRLEIVNAIAGATKGAKRDPDNAYWKQMLACLYHQLGDEATARRHWMTASACANWNDYQSTDLLAERQRFGKDFGALESWQLAYVYYQRSPNTAQLINSYARFLLSSAPIDIKKPLACGPALLLRAAVVINGDLLREGARSISVAGFGSEMAELACQVDSPGKTPRGERFSYHKLHTARTTLVSNLEAIGEPTLAHKVDRAYRESDAWDAYLDPEMAAEEAMSSSYLSLLYVGFPSMMVVIGLVGAFLALIGFAFQRVERIQLVPTVIAGVLLAIGSYLITFLPLVSVATFLCCIFLTLGPKRERKVKIDDLGPMFSFTIGTLGVVFMVLLGGFVIGSSAPAVSLLPVLNVPQEYFGGSGVLLGLSIIVLGILLLMAPMFAIALRVGTAFVLFNALKKLGAFLAYTALGAIVIGTPICIYFDRGNSNTLQRIVSNEPMHYLSLP
jgi:hypothetical protein